MTHLSGTTVEADPRKPFKAIASAAATAVLVALTAYFTGHNDISWNGVVTTLVSAAVSFVLTYLVKNPKVVVGGPGVDNTL